MSNPLVSVVVTSYNQKDILSRAIDSVIEQTYKNIEIVITDDGSTDGSQDLINKYVRKYPELIKPVLSDRNQGIPKNKNQGFRVCNGDFITYLDGDDYFFHEKIERELKIFQSDSKLGIVYSNFAFADEDGTVLNYWNQGHKLIPQGYIFENVFSRDFPHWTLYRNELIKAEILKNINYYDENIIAFEDWDSRIRMTKNAKVGYSDYVGSAYVNDPRGISKLEKRQRLIQEMRNVIKKNLDLLDNLPFDRKIKILKSLNISLTKQEFYSTSYLLLKLILFIKYLAISGDLGYGVNLIARKLKLSQ